MVSTSQLDRLVERVARVDPGVLPSLREAVETYRRPPAVHIAGRRGAGTSTVARALGLTDALCGVVDDPDALAPELNGDLVVYVLAETLHRSDREALRAVRPGHALVVLNKADGVAGGTAGVLARSNEFAAALGVRTVPLIATTAAATQSLTVTAAEVSSLRTLAALHDPTLTLSAELFLAADVVVDVRARRTMLARWELFGLECAMAALAADRDLGPQQIQQVMHAASGVDAARAAVTRRLAESAALRGGELLDDLARLAVRSRARNEFETYLLSPEAGVLGLRAGLAEPAIADVVASAPTGVAGDRASVARLAGWWRVFAGGDVAPRSRRAALRIHDGYLRSWSASRGVG